MIFDKVRQRMHPIPVPDRATGAVPPDAFREVPPFAWVKYVHYSFTSHYESHYRCSATGALHIIATKRDRDGFPTDETDAWYELPGDRREFKTEEELREAITSHPKAMWRFVGMSDEPAPDTEDVDPSPR